MATRKRTDVLTAAQRRYCMSRIKGRDTTPEIRLRRALWSLGLRYRVRSNLAGKPDISFSSAKVVVFVDGCQWHSCPQHWVRPKSNVAFWDAKFKRNRERDAEVTRLLTAKGWKVMRFWEHEVFGNCDSVARRVARTVVIRQRNRQLGAGGTPRSDTRAKT